MTAPSPTSPGVANTLLILLLGVIWGTVFMSTTLALEGISLWWVAAGRLAIAAAFLLPLGALMGQGLGTLNSARAWVFSTVIGVGAYALPLTLLGWGLSYVPSAFAGVAMGAIPLMVLPLVAIFSREEGIGPRRIIGVCLGFVGLVLLVGPGALEDGTLSGRVACIGAAACYAAGSVLTRRAPKIPPVAFAGATLLMGAIAMVPLAWIIDGPLQITETSAMWALLYTAIFPTALAAILRVRVITTAGSVFMSFTSYMIPVWAVLFGVTLMGEALPPQLFWALGLILAGIAISQSRTLLQQLRPRTRTE
ncbi:DMT family transporter [Rhodobacteraceae bacterium N5(2021)]|uniref:DMT family transporter n=1 Tax=Gymnodinialimonas phycosphaerae TaxID=2841589 RepID=A0A975TUT9_9RHOB|nr:DMT family transporter [Gymnodinialimonas phycosphaerae]MBY4895259.1 DMT family transporter [Gymnodinialimonas phycosphaerae]